MQKVFEKMKNIIKLIRPKHYIKNFFDFFTVIF